MQALVLVVLARLLTPDDFGLMGAALVVLSFSGIAGELGVGSSIVQLPRLEAAHVGTALTITFATALAFGAAAYLGAGAIAAFFRMPSLEYLVRLLSAAVLTDTCSVVPQGLLRREMRFRALAIIEVTAYAAGYALVAIPLAYLGFGAQALIIAYLVQSALRLGLSVFAASEGLTKPRFAVGEGRELLFTGGGFTLAKVANQFALQADNVVVGRWIGAAGLGLYSRAYQLMVVPADLFGRGIDKVAFSAIASVQGDTKRVRRAFARGVSLTGLVGLPLSGMLVVLAPEIVSVILGGQWEEVVPVLQILGSVTFFRICYRIGSTILKARGRVYRNAVYQFLYAAVVGLAAYAGQEFGVPGVASGVALAVVLHCGLLLMGAARELAVRPRAVLVWLVPPFAVFSVSTMGALGVASLLRGVTPAWLVLLAGLSGAGGAVAILIVLAGWRVLGEEAKWLREMVMEESVWFLKSWSDITKFLRLPKD